jgi:hypothetical protein
VQLFLDLILHNDATIMNLLQFLELLRVPSLLWIGQFLDDDKASKLHPRQVSKDLTINYTSPKKLGSQNASGYKIIILAIFMKIFEYLPLQLKNVIHKVSHYYVPFFAV